MLTVFWSLMIFYLAFAAIAVADRPFETRARGLRRVVVQFVAALGYALVWPIIAIAEGPQR